MQNKRRNRRYFARQKCAKKKSKNEKEIKKKNVKNKERKKTTRGSKTPIGGARVKDPSSDPRHAQTDVEKLFEKIEKTAGNFSRNKQI